jgi:hypothetical protein
MPVDISWESFEFSVDRFEWKLNGYCGSTTMAEFSSVHTIRRDGTLARIRRAAS